MSRLAVRIAVSEAAAWTGRRFGGGRYGVIPNGVDLLPLAPRRPRARSTTPRKHRVLQEADVLCAPSLGGESFGMVLTEAFAAGTPVIASDIAGYRDVLRHGVDGLLIPRDDAGALTETLRALAADPAREQALGRNAAQAAERLA